MLLSQLEGAQRGIALLEEALEDAAGNDALQASLHGRLAVLGRLTKGMTWAERHARAAVDVADRLDDDTLRAGALPRSRSSGSTAAPQTLPEKPSVHTSSPWCPATPQLLQRAEYMFAHVLSWSVLHRACT